MCIKCFRCHARQQHRMYSSTFPKFLPNLPSLEGGVLTLLGGISGSGKQQHSEMGLTTSPPVGGDVDFQERPSSKSRSGCCMLLFLYNILLLLYLTRDRLCGLRVLLFQKYYEPQNLYVAKPYPCCCGLVLLIFLASISPFIT